MKAEDVLKKLQKYEDKIKESRSKHVAVGLPKEKTSGEIYGNSQTVIDIGAHHEYGTSKVPRRSFLRAPFNIKKKDMDRHIKKFYKLVFEKDMSVDKALGLIGVEARNIVMDAFATNGFGQWPAIKAGTIAKKGSDKPLFDTGTLRNSITHVVRGGK